MLKMLKVFTACAAALVVVISALCVITPERDKFGNYTDGVRYWCNDVYFNTHF